VSDSTACPPKAATSNQGGKKFGTGPLPLPDALEDSTVRFSALKIGEYAAYSNSTDFRVLWLACGEHTFWHERQLK
jgi:hypothetical protein